MFRRKKKKLKRWQKWVLGIPAYGFLAYVVWVIGYSFLYAPPSFEWYLAELNKLVVYPEDPSENAYPLWRKFWEEDLGWSVNTSNKWSINSELDWSDLSYKLSTLEWNSEAAKMYRDEFRPQLIYIPTIDYLAAKPFFAMPYLDENDIWTGFDPRCDPLFDDIEIAALGFPAAAEQAMVRCARLNTIRLRDAAERSDWNEFQQAVQTGLNLVEQVSQRITSSGEKNAIMMEQRFFEELLFAVQEQSMPPDACDALIALIQKNRYFNKPFDRAMAGWYLEEASGYSAVHRELEFRLYLTAGFATRHGAMQRFRKKRVDQKAIGILGESHPIAPDEPTFTYFEREYLVGTIWDFGNDWGYSPMARLYQYLFLAEDSITVMLAIEKYFNEHGEYTDTLEEMVDSELLVDSVMGGRFRYERLDNDTNAGHYELRLPLDCLSLYKSRFSEELDDKGEPVGMLVSISRCIEPSEYDTEEDYDF